MATLGGRFSLELGIDLDRGPGGSRAMGARCDAPRQPNLDSCRHAHVPRIRTCGSSYDRRCRRTRPPGAHLTPRRRRLCPVRRADGDTTSGSRGVRRRSVRRAAWHARRGGRGRGKGARAGPRGSARLGSGHRRSVPSRAERRVATCGPTARRERGLCSTHVKLPDVSHALSTLAAAAHLDLRDLEAGLSATLPLPRFRQLPGRRGVSFTTFDRDQLTHF